jgi:hypothetical protein
MRERLDLAREEEERKWQEELQQRVAESRRRDLERQSRAAEREAEEAQRQAEEASQALGGDALLKPLRPSIARKPIDSELIFPGRLLPTLLDYVRLLKGMSQGDPLKAMGSAGLDVATWSAVATAWGQAMVGRMALGLRFGELMAAPWE